MVPAGTDTVFAKKYLSPLIGCSAFRAWVFDRDTEAAAIHSFVAAYRALAQAAPGYEFAVRDHLSAVCLALCRRFTDNFQKVDVPHRNQDEYRVQQMLTYIQKNFAHSITVGDIAGAAGIGERECLRCFQKTIHVPPIQYLLKYRIMQGADALLAESAEVAADIDTARAEAARDRAEKRLAEGGENIDHARAEAALQRAMMRLQIANLR